MDKKPIKFITALADLYKVIFESESTKADVLPYKVQRESLPPLARA